MMGSGTDTILLIMKATTIKYRKSKCMQLCATGKARELGVLSYMYMYM